VQVRLIGVPALGGEFGPSELADPSSAHRAGNRLEPQQPGERPQRQPQVPGDLRVHVLAAEAETFRQLAHGETAAVVVQ
jgi:hypothetical protein